jgi:hypothetical protein
VDDLQDKAGHQVSLDYSLITAARRFINGANVHRVKQLIFVYEQAVVLHNVGWPAHRIYQDKHERALRDFVAKERFGTSEIANGSLF